MSAIMRGHCCAGSGILSVKCIFNQSLLCFNILLCDLPWKLIPKPWSFFAMASVLSSFRAVYCSAVPALNFLLVIFTLLDRVDAHSILTGSGFTENHPTTEFSRYFITKPQIHHGRSKRALSSTSDEQGIHSSNIILSYVHNGEKVVADLRLNKDLLPERHFLYYQNDKNGVIDNNFNKTALNLCHYQGAIRGKANSRVAVSTCYGINGLIYDGSESYYIYSDAETKLHGDHYIFRNSDILYNSTCGTSPSLQDRVTENNELKQQLRYKRSNSENTIRGPYNANRHSSYVELVIVVDNKVYKSLGENIKTVHNHCKDIANIVNALYVPLNIFVALVGVVVWNEANEIELSSNGDDTLKNFLHYRRTFLIKYPNDNAQLLTKEQFEGGVVGKALKGPICTYEYSGGVSMEHSNLVAVVATTVAHEMGHNFGMEHDTDDCECSEDKCIMSASSTSLVPRHWSSCSIDQLNVAFSHGMNYCLRNKPGQLFDSPQCGNGFVEFGEQCDCGLPKFCENSCCNPSTCMLNANASCATGDCCDLSTCLPKNPGIECRNAEGECDLPEYCTGESEYCPPDIHKRDTELCDNGNSYCFKGLCRSRTNQCKILWGPSGESSDYCYEKNVDGTRHGNCGYDRLQSKYIPCAESNIQCGMLHCKHLNERLEFGMESVAILSHSFMNHDGTIIPCRTAIVDLGLQSPDPGLTPNGSKCGDGKICVNQKCESIANLEAMGIGAKCPNDCNNQGTCNSRGHCHCRLGFAPPDCLNPGQGGSIDSGPASNPNGRIGFTRAMYIFFLGIVPCIAIVSFLTYYWKQNHHLQLRKATNVAKHDSKSSPPAMSPSSADDMNSALLKNGESVHSSYIHNAMFGKFKGFTLKPLANSTNISATSGVKIALVHPVINPTLPIRAAPPVPKRPIEIEKNSHLDSTNTSDMNAFSSRPHISNPVLNASTCSARELESVNKQQKIEILHGNRTIQRPFRNNQEANTSLPKSDTKTSKPLSEASKGQENVRNLEISSPIPIIDDVQQQSLKNPLVQRTQSLRSPSITPKRDNETYWSMRPARTLRPKSLVGVRPKSPPPRPPIPGAAKENTRTIQKLGVLDENSVPTKSENIYAVIDEITSPLEDSGDNIGLLGEIVSEMKKQNQDTRYTNTSMLEKSLPAGSQQNDFSGDNTIKTTAVEKTPDIPKKPTLNSRTVIPSQFVQNEKLIATKTKGVRKNGTTEGISLPPKKEAVNSSVKRLKIESNNLKPKDKPVLPVNAGGRKQIVSQRKTFWENRSLGQQEFETDSKNISKFDSSSNVTKNNKHPPKNTRAKIQNDLIPPPPLSPKKFTSKKQ